MTKHQCIECGAPVSKAIYKRCLACASADGVMTPTGGRGATIDTIRDHFKRYGVAPLCHGCSKGCPQPAIPTARIIFCPKLAEMGAASEQSFMRGEQHLAVV
jgi:hypothetical protein